MEYLERQALMDKVKYEINLLFLSYSHGEGHEQYVEVSRKLAKAHAALQEASKEVYRITEEDK